MIHLKIIPNTPKFQKRFQELVGDYDVAKTTASMPHPCSSEDAESFIGSIQNPTSLYKTLGIYQDHKLVGVIHCVSKYQ